MRTQPDSPGMMDTVCPEAREREIVATSKRRNSSLSLKISPKDDWSKIKEKEQRRRIQNRLYQRAFRQRKVVPKSYNTSLNHIQALELKEIRRVFSFDVRIR